MNKYIAIYQVMMALAAQPVMIPNMGWIPLPVSKHNKHSSFRHYY